MGDNMKDKVKIKYISEKESLLKDFCINVTQENRPLLNTEILYFLIIHEPGEKV